MVARAAGQESVSVVEITFELSDPSIPVVALTTEVPCRLNLEQIVPRTGGRYAAYYAIDGCNPEQVHEAATEFDRLEVIIVDHAGQTGILECAIPEDVSPVSLAADEAVPRHQVVQNGTMVLTLEVLPTNEVNRLITLVKETYPAATLRSRHQQSSETPLFMHRDLESALDARLTDRQGEVLQAAYESGFYEWPRSVTGKQLAAELDVSAPTFHQHRRAAELEVFQLLFEDGGFRMNERVDICPGER